MGSSPLPAWSGEVWITAEGDAAFMSVHYADDRLHRPPEGWVLEGVEHDDECETYVYVRA